MEDDSVSITDSLVDSDDDNVPDDDGNDGVGEGEDDEDGVIID